MVSSTESTMVVQIIGYFVKLLQHLKGCKGILTHWVVHESELYPKLPPMRRRCMNWGEMPDFSQVDPHGFEPATGPQIIRPRPPFLFLQIKRLP